MSIHETGHIKQLNRTVSGISLWMLEQLVLPKCCDREKVIHRKPMPCVFDHGHDSEDPTFDSIYSFIHSLFKKARIEPECLLAGIVLMRRYLEKYTGLSPNNWKRLLFTCLMLGSKSQDDVSCTSRSFSYCTADFTLHELNKMERNVLTAIGYNLVVTVEEYAEIYYELKEFAATVSFDSMGYPIVQKDGSPVVLKKGENSFLIADKFMHPDPAAGLDVPISSPMQPLDSLLDPSK
ncbi:hypothetical protein ADUPG1_006193 [Aduncisulcus paluster]|uniref:Cyclin-like domain-containing protein n=1 Tax=Aduncisulcus paluster TaxID=2918883 RepID=A0ABQ5KH60_9EUKA|nr:hypothetical protein ADUPG1_006193 [Aduncisulcus paluster]